MSTLIQSGAYQGKLAKFVNGSLINAAQGLQLLLATPITFKTDFHSISLDHGVPQFCTKGGKNTYLLKTNVGGNLKGAFYLVMDQSELDRISVLSDQNDISEELNEVLKMDFILEVNNLLSSSIISQLDDSWEKNALCKMPKTYLLDGNKISKHILLDLMAINAKNEFKATFYAHHIGVSMELIFVFRETSSQSIPDFKSENNEKCSSLSSMQSERKNIIG